MIFCHIPKTAGTSLRTSLERELKTHNVAYDYGDVKKTSPIVLKYIYKDRDFYTFLQKFRSSQIRLLAGHFPIKKYLGLFNSIDFFSLVRDPAERVVSEFHHLKREKRIDCSLEDFYRNPSNMNIQYNFLNGLPLSMIGYIGIMERYKESLLIINEEYELSLNELNLNRANQHNFKLSQFEIKEIENLNKKDVWLYRKCIELHEKKIWALREGFEYIRGAIYMKNNLILGWALSTSNELPIEINVYKNSQFIMTIFAKDFLGDNAFLQKYRNGCVGFRLSEINISCNDVIDCRVKDTGQSLLNSPLIIKDMEL